MTSQDDAHDDAHDDRPDVAATLAPPAAWVPPTALPAAPASAPWAQYAPPSGSPEAPARRGGRWLWPGVASLAMLIGLIGGVGGSIAYQEWQDDPADVPGTVSDGLAGVDTVALPPLLPDDGTVAAVAQALLPSTVQISAEFEGENGGATGSGFVLDNEGHIVTNNHVVEDAAEGNGQIEIVDEEGNRFKASVVGRSPVYDLAVLFAPGATGLEPAALGSSERLRVGEAVVAFGSPLGLSSTVTSGIVSALSRPVTTGSTADDSSYINAVQTDAAINPGNSGGPLVNLRGQVVGVNSAIATNGGGSVSGEAGNIGVGFAIPVEQVRITADQILRTGEARYPVIGASVQTGGRSTGTGAEIQEVTEGSPAQAAGLAAGDLITSVDGDRVTDGISLIVAIRTYQPGETVAFNVRRDGTDQSVSITLGGETG